MDSRLRGNDREEARGMTGKKIGTDNEEVWE
jgi:hypothetical protein